MSEKDFMLEGKDEYRIGVISDTHGIVRDLLHNFLKGVDLIFHAGDVCGEDVLDELSLIAPVVAVRGNMDFSDKYNPSLPVFRYIDIGGFRCSISHDLIDLKRCLQSNRSDKLKNIAIFGHTHIPVSYREDDIYFINPGSCGPKRQGKPVSYTILNLVKGSLSIEMHEF